MLSYHQLLNFEDIRIQIPKDGMLIISPIEMVSLIWHGIDNCLNLFWLKFDQIKSLKLALGLVS